MTRADIQKIVEGSCHCGSVQVKVARLPTEVTECRCSICRRYGALWAYYPPREVALTGPTKVYAWRRRYIGFHHCSTCGCVVGWLPLYKDIGHCAVNARMLGQFGLEAVTRIVEDDASM